MSARKVLLTVTLLLVVCLCLGWLVQPAFAQDDLRTGADKKIGTKQGLDVLKNAGSGEKPKASKVQMAVGIGSIFVMIAILKWL